MLGLRALHRGREGCGYVSWVNGWEYGQMDEA